MCLNIPENPSWKQEWLSRDNLSSPLFALVTYMKSFYKIRSELQGKIKRIFLTNCKLCGGGRGVSDLFLTKNQNLKKNVFGRGLWVL